MTDPKKLSESNIVRAIADEVCRRCTRKTIAILQSMNATLLSGDDSGLGNTWDELCVQLQYEQSFYWPANEQTVWGFVEGYIEVELKPHEREAIWLQTLEGIDWQYEDDESRVTNPVVDSEIVEYLLKSWIYRAAENWTNSRIRTFLDRR